MRKIMAVAVIAMVCAGPGMALADGHMGEMKKGECKMGSGKERVEQCDKKAMDWKKGMRGGWKASKQLVALDDGGIVVLSGNKLLKYDSDLNLVKEVEIKCEKKAECGDKMKDKCCMGKESEEKMKSESSDM